MSTPNSVDAIELLYKKYKKEIFAKLIWAHLFDDDVKYEDKDIFEKTEKYLRNFFASQGVEWSDENREKIRLLVLNSDNEKIISDHFQKNYEYCLINKLNWTPDSSVQRMINQLIDASIQNKTRLSYYYAKRLLVKYYYDMYSRAANHEIVVGNLMTIFFTYNEVQRLVQETQLNLDALITKSYHSLNGIICKTEKKIEPKIFIRKFMMLKSVHACLRYNPQLKEQLLNCQYVSVYRDLLEKIECGVEYTPVKEIQRRPVGQKQNVESSSKTEGKVQPKPEEQGGITSETKPSHSSDTKTDSNDAMDVFLKKIGGRNKSVADPIAELLSASKEIIRGSEEHRYTISTTI